MFEIEDLMTIANFPVSYAQEREDLILYRYLYPVKEGFYIDVGCNHPTDLSVTKFFYERGWTGINIDPLKDVIRLYKTERPKDMSICMGISDREGTVEFFDANFGSTIVAEDAARRGLAKKTTIPAITLSSLLEKISIRRDIHFLKIDVEKAELQVLRGCDFATYRPWLLVIEATLPGTTIPCHEEWENIVLDNGYSFLSAHGINRYYCANEKREEMIANLVKSPVFAYITPKQRAAVSKITKALLR